jgi:hypothetical protein
MGGASSSSAGGAGGAGGGLVGTRLRLVAGNLTSGNAQSYDSGEGIRLFQGAHPDVAMVQEMNYGNNSDIAIRSFVDQAFGANFDYHRETTVGLPNGVVSRYPILASGEWVDPIVVNRSFVWAQIDVPGPTDLWAISVHLLTSGATDRDTEAKSLIGLIAAHVPMGDFVVIGGDFNTKDRMEPCIVTFGAALSVGAPFPVDNLGNDNTNGPRTRPYDWLLVDPGLAAIGTPVVIGQSNFATGLVLDSRVYSPLADIAPVMLGDSGSANMQHMAIVKDFLLP